MAPVATVLDRLQGDSVYFGSVIPTLHQTIKNIKKVQVKLSFMIELKNHLISSIRSRFGDLLLVIESGNDKPIDSFFDFSSNITNEMTSFEKVKTELHS